MSARGADTLTPGEEELKRRLGDLASLAAVDPHPQAWARFEERRSGAAAPRRLPTRKQLLAVAAVILVVCAVVLARQDSSGDSVRMVDDPTTTTSEGGRRRASTTSSSAPASTTSSAPTPPEGGPSGTTSGSPEGAGPRAGGSGPDDAAGPGATGDGSGGGPGAGGVPGTGSGSGAAGPAAGGGAPGGGSTTTTTAGPTTPGTIDGKTVWASYAAPGYTLLLTLEGGGSPYLTTTIYRDDGTLVRDWVWPARPGQNCLVGVVAMPFDFPEGQHSYTFGLVRADAAAVRIVNGSGAVTTVPVGGEAHPGVRPWVTRRQADDVARMEALDGAGNVLTAADASSGFDSYPAAC